MRLLLQAFTLSLSLLGLPGGAQAFIKCMPIYGNWCGIDYPPEGTFPPPIDEFDAACMRHDLCTGGSDFFGNERCDRALVAELNLLRAKYGFLPRPLQWAEYALRVKSGGPWGRMPMPSPGDLFGFMDSAMASCW